ncbi:MAG: hypothetical protein HQ539_02965 [Parcubacteria group bacterium]|nr:hypothetical protein [Parcubacteria group bacterium]
MPASPLWGIIDSIEILKEFRVVSEAVKRVTPLGGVTLVAGTAITGTAITGTTKSSAKTKKALAITHPLIEEL